MFTRGPKHAGGTAILLILCTILSCRRPEDASRSVAGHAAHPRRTEARLSNAAEWSPCTSSLQRGHVIADTTCRPSHILKVEASIANECEEMIGDYAMTLEMLVSRPQCTDTAVESLESFVEGKPSALMLSDLGAAYSLRSERQDRPSDLVRFLDAMERAFALNPTLPEVRFNYALALGSLGFVDESSQQWLAISSGPRSQWSAEAARRLQDLRQQQSDAAAAQWPRNMRRMSELARNRGEKTAGALIDPFPAASHRYVEEAVLPAWANADLVGNESAARLQLAIAEAIATRLFRQTHDRYLLDGIETITAAQRSDDRARIALLRRAHQIYGDAKRSQTVTPPATLARAFHDAARLLEEAGSPLAASASLERAVMLSFENEFASASSLLTEIEERARPRGYLYVTGRAESNQAYFLMYQSRFIDAIVRYETAASTFAQVDDKENVANARTRKAGILRTMGNTEQAWREVFLALQGQQHVVEAPARHEFFGESAETALSLGYPRIALRFQKAAVRLFEDQLKQADRTDTTRIRRIERNLGIAMRALASIYLSMELYAEASESIARAIALTPAGLAKTDDSVREALLARIREVEGVAALLQNQPAAAIKSFNSAVELTASTPFPTFRARLLIERADAYRKLNKRREAEIDLKTAIADLRAEEILLLEGRTRGDGEELWSVYFSRSRETYQKLIHILIEDGRSREAFAFAEAARAFEPLQLVLQLKSIVPEPFRQWTRRGAMSLKQIQATLPADTYLVEYSVQSDQTYVWIVSRKTFRVLTLPVQNAVVRRWTNALRRHADREDIAAFESILHDAYAGLLHKVESEIEPTKSNPVPRLVFSPDGAMHGLPFAALRLNSRSQHLVRNYRIALTPSGTMLAFAILRDRQLDRGGTPHAVLIGNPAFSESDVTRGLKRLPRGEREVARISQFYSPYADVLIDKDATVERFLTQAQRAVVGHLAGHAVVPPQAPFRSLMLLAPSPVHNGSLDAVELLARFKADHMRLFVLSACSSSGGTTIGAEGLAPLVRPLITAGIPAVVGTLWNVGDASTEELLVRFHCHYRNGYSADEALRLAQIAMLRDENAGLRSVLAWAPFQVIGYASSPFKNNQQETCHGFYPSNLLQRDDHVRTQ